MQPNRFARSLPCDLTRDEAALKAQQLAATLRDRQEAEAEKREVVSGYAVRLKEYESALQKLAYQIRTNSEHRQVECVERPNFRSNTVEVVRLDVGEIVEVRPMTAMERQETLAFEGEEAGEVDDDVEVAAGGSH